MDLLYGAEATIHIRTVRFQFNFLLSNDLYSVASDWKGSYRAIAAIQADTNFKEP
jgi:hypothetical protein